MPAQVAWRLRAAIVAATMLLAGCASGTAPAHDGAPAAQPPHATQQVRFVPTTGVARTDHGSCWTSSITVRATAYRCFAGDQILDPCFPSTSPRSVLCYADPWSEAVRLDLDRALPRPDPLSIAHPWALELRDGTHCVAVTGVVNRVRDVPMLFRCGSHGMAGMPAGRPSVVEYTATGAEPLLPRGVDVIWQA